MIGISGVNRFARYPLHRVTSLPRYKLLGCAKNASWWSFLLGLDNASIERTVIKKRERERSLKKNLNFSRSRRSENQSKLINKLNKINKIKLINRRINKNLFDVLVDSDTSRFWSRRIEAFSLDSYNDTICGLSPITTDKSLFKWQWYSHRAGRDTGISNLRVHTYQSSSTDNSLLYNACMYRAFFFSSLTSSLRSSDSKNGQSLLILIFCVKSNERTVKRLIEQNWNLIVQMCVF